MKQAVEPEGVPAPQGSYSSAIVSGDLIYTSGQAGFDPKTDELVSTEVGPQTLQTLDNLDAVLQAAGSGLEHVLKVTVHLADIGLFAEYDAAYRSRMPQPFPARTTVASGMDEGILVEIDVVARKPAGA